ncbi:hypothetical protein [Ascidiaceihabitans sp.]|uniref:hypothetical protein n=1 Tax=Ascidiaceihabitans sp. TaxID=1872644 RepID=UPI00329853A9
MVSIFDYWGAIVGLISVVGVVIAWRGTRKPKAGKTQTMTNSSRSRQEAIGGDIDQNMDNVTDGEQKG